MHRMLPLLKARFEERLVLVLTQALAPLKVH